MEEIRVREIGSEDVGIVSEIICRNLIDVNSRDYTAEEINRYVEHFTSETVMKLAEEREMLVAESVDGIVGTASLGTFGEGEDKEWTVFTVFVKTDYHGRGIGRVLMDEIEELAKSRGINELTVPAGLTAYDFYKKQGYKEKSYLEDEKIHLMKKTML